MINSLTIPINVTSTTIPAFYRWTEMPYKATLVEKHNFFYCMHLMPPVSGLLLELYNATWAQKLEWWTYHMINSLIIHITVTVNTIQSFCINIYKFTSILQMDGIWHPNDVR